MKVFGFSLFCILVFVGCQRPTSDENLAFFCSGNTDQKSCSDDGCVWDEGIAACHSKTFSSCGSYSESLCDTIDGCVFSKEMKICYSTSSLPFNTCSSYPQDVCNSPKVGCFWNAKYNECMSPKYCSSFSGDKNACADAGCAYDTSLATCESALKPCYFYSAEETCSAAGCVWNGHDCRTKHFCGSFPTLDLCQSNGCVWDESSCKSKIISLCGSYISKSGCEESGCYWDSNQNCISNAILSCSSLTTEKSCVDFGCVWDLDKCLSGVISSCSSFMSPDACKESGCYWDAAQNTCLSPNLTTCSTVSSQPACEDLGCIWDVDVCASQLGSCTSFKGQEACESFEGCIFEEGSKKCFSKNNVECTDLTQKTCLEQGCQWNANSNVCTDDREFHTCFHKASTDECQSSQCIWMGHICMPVHVGCLAVSGSCPTERGCIVEDGLCKAPLCKTNHSQFDCELELGCAWNSNEFAVGQQGVCKQAQTLL